MKTLSNSVRKLVGENFIDTAKRMLYSRRGEPIEYGKHRLRYLVGTRPPRLKYLNGTDASVRDAVKQIKFFLDHVKPGETVLDIGGHNGQYAVLFASLVGRSGMVLTFEPDESAIKILRKNLVLNPCTSNVTVETVALADESGFRSFYSRGGDSMSSLARSGLGQNADSPDVTENTVQIITLDDYLQKKQINSVHWIKLDTEGAEIAILRGARNCLKTGVVVVCELHPYVWHEFGTTFGELLDIVRECGRTIHYLDEAQRIADGPMYGTVIIS